MKMVKDVGGQCGVKVIGHADFAFKLRPCADGARLIERHQPRHRDVASLEQDGLACLYLLKKSR